MLSDQMCYSVSVSIRYGPPTEPAHPTKYARYAINQYWFWMHPLLRSPPQVKALNHPVVLASSSVQYLQRHGVSGRLSQRSISSDIMKAAKFVLSSAIIDGAIDLDATRGVFHYNKMH
jgi:hypothetical protein